MLRPLQVAACTCRIAFGPRAGQKVLPVQGIMPREGGVQAGPVRRHRPVQPARHGSLLRRRSPRAGTTVPLHHAPDAVQRAGAAQLRWAGGAEARDTLAQRHHASGDFDVGVHAAVGCAGADASRPASEPRVRRPSGRLVSADQFRAANVAEGSAAPLRHLKGLNDRFGVFVSALGRQAMSAVPRDRTLKTRFSGRLDDRLWPMPGTPSDEFDGTLLTFKS